MGAEVESTIDGGQPSETEMVRHGRIARDAGDAGDSSGAQRGGGCRAPYPHVRCSRARSPGRSRPATRLPFAGRLSVAQPVAVANRLAYADALSLALAFRVAPAVYEAIQRGTASGSTPAPTGTGTGTPTGSAPASPCRGPAAGRTPGMQRRQGQRRRRPGRHTRSRLLGPRRRHGELRTSAVSRSATTVAIAVPVAEPFTDCDGVAQFLSDRRWGLGDLSDLS